MENTNKKTDRRIVKTKKAIRNAFAELLTQKDINEITVKDISDVADINRKTFYNYYNGLYQLIDEIENEIVASFEKVIGEIDLKRNLTDPYHFFIKLTAIINNDIDFYSHLLKTDSNSSLVSKLAASLKERFQTSLSNQSNVDYITLEIMAEYIFSGMLAVYRNWFNSNREHSLEDISEIVSILTTAGANGILDRQS